MTPTDFLKHIKQLLSSLAEMTDIPVMIDDGQMSITEDLQREAVQSGIGLSVLLAETGMRGENCRGRKVALSFGVSVYQPCQWYMANLSLYDC